MMMMKDLTTFDPWRQCDRMWNAQRKYKTTQYKFAAESDPLNFLLGMAAGFGMKKLMA